MPAYLSVEAYSSYPEKTLSAFIESARQLYCPLECASLGGVSALLQKSAALQTKEFYFLVWDKKQKLALFKV